MKNSIGELTVGMTLLLSVVLLAAGCYCGPPAEEVQSLFEAGPIRTEKFRRSRIVRQDQLYKDPTPYFWWREGQNRGWTYWSLTLGDERQVSGREIQRRMLHDSRLDLLD